VYCYLLCSYSGRPHGGLFFAYSETNRSGNISGGAVRVSQQPYRGADVDILEGPEVDELAREAYSRH
jgi:hypothetical protein